MASEQQDPEDGRRSSDSFGGVGVTRVANTQRRHTFHTDPAAPAPTLGQEDSDKPALPYRHSYHAPNDNEPVCTCSATKQLVDLAEERRNRQHWNAHSECGRHGDRWLVPRGLSFSGIVAWFKRKVSKQ